MMLYRNNEVKFSLPDGGSDYFHIVVGVLHGDTLALHLFIIGLDYMLRKPIDKIKDSGFKRTKESRTYPAKQ